MLLLFFVIKVILFLRFYTNKKLNELIQKFKQLIFKMFSFIGFFIKVIGK